MELSKSLNILVNTMKPKWKCHWLKLVFRIQMVVFDKGMG